MTPEGRSLHSGYALRNSQERCTHNLLCTKHFHGVPLALYQKSGQYADPSVNKTFLASF